MFPWTEAQELHAVAEYATALRERADRWVPAGGGREVPCIRNGRAQLYVWNPATGQHGWLDLSTDVVAEADPINDWYQSELGAYAS